MISKIVQSMNRSVIRKMYDMAFEYKNTINFTVGEPDFITPSNIIEAACEHLRKGETHYTPNAGIVPLRQAISKKYSTEIRKIDPLTEVIVTCGASEALLLAMQTVLDPGDEVLLCNPYFASYINQIKICHAVPRFLNVHEENDFILDCDELEKNINERSKLLILNSPCNPTGAVIDIGTLEKISQIAIKHDLVVISDEVYKKIIYDDNKYVSIASLPGMAQRTIVIDSFSKSYAMTGWRIGFAIAPKEILKEMVKLHESNTACISAPYQYAALEALENSEQFTKEMLMAFKNRRDLLCNGIEKINGILCRPPKGAFYIFANIKKFGISSEDFAIELLKSSGVVLVPGSGFGANGEGYVRLSFATSEANILEGLNRIEAFVKKL